MFKVTIYTIGKVKEPWLAEGLEEYTTRLKKVMAIEWVLIKTDEELTEKVVKLNHYICLDPVGKNYSSDKFSTWFYELMVKQGSRLNIVIGGAEGFSEAIRKKAGGFISLSPMTFTHQITRLVLLEQLYRAIEIYKGSAYHK